MPDLETLADDLPARLEPHLGLATATSAEMSDRSSRSHDSQEGATTGDTGLAEAVLRLPDGAYHTYMLLSDVERKVLIGS